MKKNWKDCCVREKLINIKAKRIIGKYKTYAEFSRSASKSEKKTVFESTLFDANKLQRQTAGLDR